MKKTIAFIVLSFVVASLFSAYYYWSNSTISTSGQTSTMGVKLKKQVISLTVGFHQPLTLLNQIWD